MNDQKAKSDAGKPQLSLVPRRIIFDIAEIREYGNSKYPEGGIDNWRNVEPERYRDAAFRHFLAYLDDPYGLDAESGLPHLHHLATNIAFLCELEDPIMETCESVPGIKGVNYPSKDQTTIKNVSTTKDSITAVLTDGEKEVEITLYEREPYVTVKPISINHNGPVLAKKVRENADGSVTFKITKGGQETIDKLLDKISKNKFNNDVVEEEPSKTIPGATVQKKADGKLNMQLSESTMKLYKDLRVEHMEPEPGWTKWEKAWRDTDSEAEYMRRWILDDKVQYGDYDYETGKIVPRES